MQSDRELLGLAAKAAAIETVYWNDGWEVPSSGEGFILPSNRLWNPLTDDGDALRLAVKLSMEVYIDQHPAGCDCTEVWSTLHPEGQQSTVIINHDGDPNAATRRAIVRAAAEMAAQVHPDHKDGGA